MDAPEPLRCDVRSSLMIVPKFVLLSTAATLLALLVYKPRAPPRDLVSPEPPFSKSLLRGTRNAVFGVDPLNVTHGQPADSYTHINSASQLTHLLGPLRNSIPQMGWNSAEGRYFPVRLHYRGRAPWASVALPSSHATYMIGYAHSVSDHELPLLLSNGIDEGSALRFLQSDSAVLFTALTGAAAGAGRMPSTFEDSFIVAMVRHLLLQPELPGSAGQRALLQPSCLSRLIDDKGIKWSFDGSVAFLNEAFSERSARIPFIDSNVTQLVSTSSSTADNQSTRPSKHGNLDDASSPIALDIRLHRTLPLRCVQDLARFGHQWT